MSVEQRPYIGTWALNQKKLVQHTPDALVFINGDLALPGCPKCGGRIDIQQYITQVSVDAGVDPASASANFSLAVPLHAKQRLVQDSQFLLRPGLEVHIYMRGYFPVKGQYSGINPEETGGIDITDLISYPYYHVFHGVVTQVSDSYSGGFQDFTINCASMLHFWQYTNMSTNASYFGARPTNSKLRQSLVGHNFTGMTPFSIIYTLFHDTAGAAGGVGFALDKKTNVDANSNALDRSLFSLNIEYWRERFKTRMINLRMHGASGRVFSTAQAAFLGRLGGSQVRKILDTQWKVKTGANSTKKFDILSTAQTLGLIRQVRDPVTGEVEVQGLDVVEAERNADPSSASQEGTGFEINVAAMQAFVSDIGNWGQVNLFESTYETKLDLANKVLEVTGWEFYQDVDGDFVFKPPLYNLDTRSNRIYRIEDIDIISLNQTEKEPEVTYVTVNGSQFKNLKGTGLENEWGVKGQYIDYRLVAQFGWRPGSFETSYFNNPRAMFFAAINRMDVLNISVRSANSTIPVRPELRPGYPLYIEYLDCFYYLQSLNHSVMYGGQSTTSLTFTGKRGKFYPPGDPSKEGIEAIDLSDTNLPRRALQILDEESNPRLVGFPNVVMALDPNAVNPLFSLAGLDLVQIDNPQVLRNILKTAEQYHLVSVDPNTGQFTIHVDDTESLEIRPIEENDSPRRKRTANDGGTRVSFSFEELAAASQKYANFSSNPNKRITSNNEVINQKRQAITQKETSIQALEVSSDSSGTRPSGEIGRLNREISQLQRDIERLQKANQSEQQRLEEALLSDPDVLILTRLLEEIGDQYLTQTEDYPQPSRSAQLLDLLSDKKAVFTNGQQPGFYRYYSSAHPNPKDQGQNSLLMVSGEGGAVGSANPLATPKTVTGFLENPQRPGPNGELPEAELGDIKVFNGLRIVRANGEDVVSTDEIQTIVFAKHSADVDSNPTTFDYSPYYSGIPLEVEERIARTFLGVVERVNPSQTIEENFRPVWEALQSWDDAPEFAALATNSFEEAAEVLGVSVEQSVSIIAEEFANSFFNKTEESFNSRWAEIESIPNTEPQRRATEFQSFLRDLRAASGGRWAPKLARRTKSKKRREESFYSPVFPVSDEGGYEVVGTYRYGRGLLISSGSTFQQVTDTDPLQFASPDAVEDFVDVLQGKSPNGLGDVNEDGERTGTQSRTTDIRTRATEALVESILENPATPSEVVEQVSDPFLQTDIGLSNWIARATENIERVPVANAAFRLADLQINVNQQSCSCRGQQSDVLIDAFNTENFVSVVDSNLDSVTEYASNQAFEKFIPWRQQQDALRGRALDNDGVTLADAVRSSVDAWNAQGSAIQENLEDVLRTSREASTELQQEFGTTDDPTTRSPIANREFREDVLTEIEDQEEFERDL